MQPNPTMQVFDKNMKRVGTLIDSFDIQRKRRINSDYELNFMVPMTSEDYQNKIKIKGHVRDERGQFYVIQSRSRSREGRKLTANIYCNHVMFKLNDFKFPYDLQVDEAYGVAITILTNLITQATGGRFQFMIDDHFDLHDIKDFGQGTCLEALNQIVKTYQCEIEPDNYTIHLKKKIGKDSGLQYRLKKNIVSSSFKDIGENLITRLFGQMKDGRTFIGMDANKLTVEERELLQRIPGTIVNGKLAVNYLVSPYVDLWASETTPFLDGEMINQDIEEPEGLLKAMRTTLLERELPIYEMSISAADLYKIDDTEPKPSLGDTVMCIDPAMNMDKLEARITELTEYPYSLDKHSEPTISNVNLQDYDDVIADLNKSKQMVDNLFSNGRVRTELFEAFAKQAIHDIDNSKTEIIWPPEGGILAQEKGNQLNQVRLTSGGLGISTDGWKTIRAAITARGIIAETIIGQLGSFVSMLIGSGNDVTQINTKGIAAGHADFNSAPFQVDMKGNVIANKLTANYAQIKNSSFTDGAIIGSSINVGNGVFTVSSSGHMVAQSAEIRGRIIASEIEGGTVTGAKIRTSIYGERIELDPNGFRFYDYSNGLRVTLGTNPQADISGHTYYNSSSQSQGLIYASTAELHVMGVRGLRLGSLYGTTNLQGSVYFSDGDLVTGLRIGISQIIGLRDELESIKAKLNSHTHTVTTPNHNHGNLQNATSGGGTFTTSTP